MELVSPVVSDAGSSEGEEGMDLFPLLSPTDSVPDTSEGPAPWVAVPPLFLQVACSLRDRDGENRQELSLPQCISTCLSEFLLPQCASNEYLTVACRYSDGGLQLHRTAAVHCVSRANFQLPT